MVPTLQFDTYSGKFANTIACGSVTQRTPSPSVIPPIERGAVVAVIGIHLQITGCFPCLSLIISLRSPAQQFVGLCLVPSDIFSNGIPDRRSHAGEICRTSLSYERPLASAVGKCLLQCQQLAKRWSLVGLIRSGCVSFGVPTRDPPRSQPSNHARCNA